MELLNNVPSENASSSTMAPCPYQEAYWIISEVIIASVGCYFLYLLCALSIFAVKRKPEKEKKTLLSVAMTSVGLGIGRVIADQFVAFLGWQSDNFCVYSVSVSVVLSYLSFSAVYVFLWMRQNYFYQKPLLKNLVNKKLVYISRTTLAVLVILGVTVAVLYQIPQVTGWDYRATSTGCRDNNDEQDFELVPFLLVILSIIGQLSLLGLLFYPFVATRKRRERLDTGSQLWIPRPTSPDNKNLLRRAVIASYKEKRKEEKASSDATALKTKQPFTSNVITSAPTFQLTQTDDEVFATDIFNQRSDSVSNTSSELESDIGIQVPSCSKLSVPNKRYRKKRRPRSPSSERSAAEDLSPERRIVKKKIPKKRPNKPRSRSNSHGRRSSKDLNELMKKVFLLALTCVVSDLLTTMVQLFLVVPELSYLALFDVNLSINITCIIISFKDWRLMMCPMIIAMKSKTSNTYERRGSARPMISKKSQKTGLRKKIVNHPSPRRFTAYVEGLAEDDAVSLRSTTTLGTNDSLSLSASPDHPGFINTAAHSTAAPNNALLQVFGKPSHKETKL